MKNIKAVLATTDEEIAKDVALWATSSREDRIAIEGKYLLDNEVSAILGRELGKYSPTLQGEIRKALRRVSAGYLFHETMEDVSFLF
jgi:hypothetical protein